MPLPQPASPFDPIERLDPGEDHFLIREKDPVGDKVITYWSHLTRNHAFKTWGTGPTGEAKRLLDAKLVQCAEAEEKALGWAGRRASGETPADTRATYADAVQSEEQISAAKRQKLQADLERNLAEADYCAAELLALDGPAASPALAEHSAAIHELALGVKYGAREAA